MTQSPMRALVRATLPIPLGVAVASGQVPYRVPSPPVRIATRPVPEPAPRQVRVRLAYAGLCRTDVYAAQGAIASTPGVVLGHEASGVVDAVGEGVGNLRVGERVALQPHAGCARCPACAAETPWRCRDRRMLGVHLDGAFAEAICVPATMCVSLPGTVHLREAAMLEPIAAALAPMTVPLRGLGVIVGEGRVAELCAAVMKIAGFEGIATIAPDRVAQADFAVVCTASAAALSDPTRWVRPGGTVVIKARPAARIDADLAAWVRHGLTVHARAYAPFQSAASLLASSMLDLGRFMADPVSYEAFGAHFEQEDDAPGTKKLMLRCGGVLCAA